MLLIVVGAHLHAEAADRPHAERLRGWIADWLETRTAANQWTPGIGPLTPRLCTDLWYLNDRDLLQRPAISIGAPGVNAATAYLANRLPPTLVVEGSHQLHLDIEGVDLRCCLWAASEDGMSAALDLFRRRYLPSFLLRAHGEPE